jgi:hypothetical protein
MEGSLANSNSRSTPKGQIVREPFPGMKAIHAVDDSFPLKMEFKDSPDLAFDEQAFQTGKLYGRQ